MDYQGIAMNATWKIKETDPEVVELLSRLFGLDRRISSILNAKGIEDPKEAQLFLHPRMSTLHSPFYMKGMSEAVERIRGAIDRNERIGIFSDSDIDGLTSLAVLLNLFERLHVDMYYRYPVDNEDYGLTEEVVREMKEEGLDLLITLDSGIRDISEIDYAGQAGIDVIVCDHHEPGDEIPDAIIVNPKQKGCGYPYRELAGVGVAFKLCHALLISYLVSFNRPFLIVTSDGDGLWVSRIVNGVIKGVQSIGSVDQLSQLCGDLGEDVNVVLSDSDHLCNESLNLPDGCRIYELSELVQPIADALGVRGKATLDKLCDVFSINRDVLDRKIDVLNSIFMEIEFNLSPKIKDFIDSVIGLVAIGTIADIMPVMGENRTIIHNGIQSLQSTSHPGLSSLLRDYNSITSKSIAWSVAPLLNAPCRFGKTELTAKFFIEKDREVLGEVLNEMLKLNGSRKNLISQIYEGTIRDIENGSIDISGDLLFMRLDIPEGLSGIIANRLSENLNKPVIVTSTSRENGYAKGSGRAFGGFKFLSVVEPLSHFFVKIGGHEQAFGFIAEIEKLDEIEKQVERAIGDTYTVSKEVQIDLEIPVEVIDLNFIKSLSIFEPHGYRNEELIFLSRGIDILDFRRIGKDERHGIFILKRDIPVKAIGWNMADAMHEYYKKKKIDLVYHLELNDFNGKVSPRLVIIDME
jgi:single-stranded-DNA-specific exonuclease